MFLLVGVQSGEVQAIDAVCPFRQHFGKIKGVVNPCISGNLEIQYLLADFFRTVNVVIAAIKIWYDIIVVNFVERDFQISDVDERKRYGEILSGGREVRAAGQASDRSFHVLRSERKRLVFLQNLSITAAKACL